MGLLPIDVRPTDIYYAVFFVAAVVCGIFSLRNEFRKYGVPMIDAVVIPPGISYCGRVCSLLLYSWENGQWSKDWFTYVSGGLGWGSTQYGSVYGALVFFFVYGKVRKIGYVRLLDLITPSVALVFAIGRMGCYAANCCHGFVLPYGWELPSYLPYPTYFPASLVTAAVNVWIYFHLKRISADDEHRGLRTGWYLILTQSERFVIEFVRTSDSVVWWLTLVQAMALPLVLLGVGLVRSRFLRSNRLKKA